MFTGNQDAATHTHTHTSQNVNQTNVVVQYENNMRTKETKLQLSTSREKKKENQREVSYLEIINFEFTFSEPLPLGPCTLNVFSKWLHLHSSALKRERGGERERIVYFWI